MNTLPEKKIGYVAGILGLLTPIVVGTLWIGSVSNTASSAEDGVKELKLNLQSVPIDVGVLKYQQIALQKQLNEMRSEQQQRDAELLAAIRANHR